MVQLYYQMGASSKEQFCPGAVLTVYRRSTDRIGEMYYSKMEVGKIKVTRNLSGRYVEATVLEGNLWPGDLAMQSSTTCYSTTAQLP